nr:thioredoxin domain-containing protein [FCB group bacterium]
QATGKEKYADTARKIFDYVLRDLKSPEGGFYSAEDADSEGEEGTFYVWKRDEIMETLGAGDGKIFCDFYGVTDGGNFEGQTNILSVRQDEAEFANLNQMDESTLRQKLDRWRGKLFDVREKREHPFKDDKILTD